MKALFFYCRAKNILDDVIRLYTLASVSGINVKGWGHVYVIERKC